MAASATQIAQLRRLVAEPTDDTYTDEALAAVIESYPLLDNLQREPYRLAATLPPTLELNPDWTPTYDLNAAAASIWEEKAAPLAGLFDFSTGGAAAGSYRRKQQYDNAMDMARYYRARRSAHTITLRPQPAPNPELASNRGDV